MSTWDEANETFDRQMRERDADSFLEDSSRIARMVRYVAGAVPDSCIAVLRFVAGRGLERDAEAAKIARSEYYAFLASMPPIPAGEVVEQLIHYYERLTFAFEDGGIVV